MTSLYLRGILPLVVSCRVDEALRIALQYGGIDGEHHMAWVIDQMVRALTAEDYEQWVATAKDGEDGPETYDWDVGVPP